MGEVGAHDGRVLPRLGEDERALQHGLDEAGDALGLTWHPAHGAAVPPQWYAQSPLCEALVDLQHRLETAPNGPFGITARKAASGMSIVATTKEILVEYFMYPDAEV